MGKLLILALLITTSCSEFMPGNGDFVVTDIEESKESSTYRMAQTKGVGQVWIIGRVGQYHIGDTVRMIKWAPVPIEVYQK